MKIKNERRSMYRTEHKSIEISKETELDYLPQSHSAGASTSALALTEIHRMISQDMKRQHSMFIRLIFGASKKPRSRAIQTALLRYKSGRKKISNSTDLKDVKASLKQALLPGVFFHSRQTTSRKESHVSFTGLAMLDFDDLPVQEVQRVLNVLKKEPDCVLYFRSPTGRGLKVLTALTYLPQSREEYKELYAIQAQRYEKKLRLKADLSQANAKCYLSFDPKAWLRQNPITIRSRETYTFFEEYINALPGKANPHLAKDSYTMGGLYASGSLPQFQSQKAAEDYISERISLRNKNDVDKAIYEFREGIKKPLLSAATSGKDFQSLYTFIGDHYDIVFDEFQRRRIIIEKGTSNEISEEVLRTNLRLSGFGVQVKTNVIEDALVKLQRSINVLHQFFEMEPHDGRDYIKEFCDAVKLKDENQREFFTSMFKKHMVRGVRGCYPPFEFPNRYVFVLTGGQSIGKSTWLRKLGLQGEGMEWGYCETPLRDDKDTAIRMSEFLVWNIEELQTSNRFGINKLKAIVSTSHSNERAAYQKKAERFQRICTFFGSTNNPEFLIDDVNTRWLIFEVEKFDFGFSTIDAKKIWRQAYSLWRKGLGCELTKEEGNIQFNRNQSFKAPDELRDVILELFERSEGAPLTTLEILEILVNDERLRNSKPTAVKVGLAMGSAGFFGTTIKKNGTNARAWKCRSRSQAKTDSL